MTERIVFAALLVVLPFAGPAAEKAIARTSHYAAFGTNKVHYLTAGKGDKALVFVHGWSGNLDFV